jgi:hypothetical protein
MSRDEPGDEGDWELVGITPDIVVPVLDRSGDEAGWDFHDELLGRDDHVVQERDLLAQWFDRWLDMANARIHVSWAETWDVGLRSQNLAGAIVISLLLASTRSKGLARCSSCGRAYAPKRQPAAGRRRYCSDDFCQKAKRRDATRDSRARKDRVHGSE